MQSTSKLPALLTGLIFVGAGTGSYYLYNRASSAETALEQARSELSTQAEVEKARLSEKQKALENERALVSQKEAEVREMEEKMKLALGDNQGEISSRDGKLTLQLVDEILFQLGEADLTDKGKSVLVKVGQALQELQDKQVWVHGHTDDTPIAKNNKRFSSNWELSTARAVTVVQFLQDEVGIAPERLAAVGFSEYRPVSKRKNKLNRRIEVVLVPGEVSVTR
jgi:chemotaxis protein MotB